MGQCCTTSAEKRAYARGEDATELSINYQRALRLQKEEMPAKKTQQMLERHSSKGSVGSIYSIGSAAFNQMTLDERDAYLIDRMKKEMAALERRKAFLENIRNALNQFTTEEDGLDSDDENDMFQDMFKQKIDVGERKMKKVDNFRLKKMKQYNRASLKRVKHASTMPVSQRRMSVSIVPRLKGERTIEWKNDFAGKLSLVRKFYDWEDIPLEFFVDREIDASTTAPTRSLLTARLDERYAMQRLMQEDVLFQVGTKEPEEVAPLPNKIHQVPVGSDVIEINLSSEDEESSDEDPPKKHRPSDYSEGDEIPY